MTDVEDVMFEDFGPGDDIELKNQDNVTEEAAIYIDDVQTVEEVDSKKWTSWLQRKKWTKPKRPYKIAFYVVLVLAFVFFVAFTVTLTTTGLVHWGW